MFIVEMQLERGGWERTETRHETLESAETEQDEWIKVGKNARIVDEKYRKECRK